MWRLQGIDSSDVVQLLTDKKLDYLLLSSLLGWRISKLKKDELMNSIKRRTLIV
jgi:hypothetical protein